MSLTQTTLHLRQQCHAKTSLEELKLALICLSHIMHRTVTGICGSLSTASDVGGRQAPAGFSDLRQSEQSTQLRGDNPLWISARSKFNEEVILGKKMNLPLATSSSLLGHVSKQGSCYEDNSPGKAKKSPDFLPCYWQNESFPNESYRVTATLRSVSLTHTHTPHIHTICSHISGASLVARLVNDLPAVQEIWVWSLGWEDPLEKEMATHSSILAWKISWTEEPGGLQSMGSQRVGHDWATNTHTSGRQSCSLSFCFYLDSNFFPRFQNQWGVIALYGNITKRKGQDAYLSLRNIKMKR